MTDRPTNNRSLSPALSPSLLPSDVPSAGLPFGPPPVKLVEQESSATRLDAGLRAQIRALASNANRVQPRSPLTAAVCWHEAGRLLNRRSSRLAEAWICHSRALSLVPDHKPAKDSLRRLARRSGEHETLAAILESQIEQSIDGSNNPAETASWHTELGSLELLSRKRPANAIDSFQEASRICPQAIVNLWLKLGASIQTSDDEELAATLAELIKLWPEPVVSDGLRLMLALLEERRGKQDSAYEWLNDSTDASQNVAAIHWIKLRLALSLNRPDEALQAIAATQGMVDPDTIKALGRLATAISIFADTSISTSANGTDQSELAFIKSALSKDNAAMLQALEGIMKLAQTADLKTAISINQMLGEWSASTPPTQLPPNMASAESNAAARGAASFVNISLGIHPLEAEATRHPSTVLLEALNKQDDHDWELAFRTLATIREQIENPQDKWPLAVVQSAIGYNHLGQSDEALEILKAQTTDTCQAPMSSLARRVDRSAKGLSSIALLEAKSATDDQQKALLTAWAASHLEKTSPDKAIELYRQSLDLAPSCDMAIAGLERILENNEERAEINVAAAMVTTDSQKRTMHLVKAGFYSLLSSDISRAAAQFDEALESAPDDQVLWQTALRYASANPVADLSKLMAGLREDNPRSEDLIWLGSLGLLSNPDVATRSFEQAWSVDADPIISLGRKEGLLASGRSVVVAGELLEQLNSIEDDARVCFAYQQMAHLDKWYATDESAATLSLNSLAKKMPGHRPTLARLAFIHMHDHRAQELAEVLAQLSNSITDNLDASMLGSASWQIKGDSLKSLDLLRSFINRSPNAFLESMELESKTDDQIERIDLLRRLGEFTKSSNFMFRLADALYESGDLEQSKEIMEKISSNDPLHLFYLAKIAFEQNDHKSMAAALSAIANQVLLPKHKNAMLLQAMQVNVQLGDTKTAAKDCLDIVTIDPQNDEAYEIGYKALSDGSDNELLSKLLQARLEGFFDPEIERKLHLELAAVLEKIGSRSLAKENIQSAIALFADDNTSSHMWLARLLREDEQWDEAIEQLTVVAKVVQDPTMGIEIFFALGELYMDHTKRLDWAEKSFMKVLGWNKTHAPSLQRLSQLYLETNNYARAAQALEHLVRLADNPTNERLSNLIKLSDILNTKLGRPGDAEKVLGEAIRLAPDDLQPVQTLLKLLSDRGDTLSFNIHLDRAIATQSAALATAPGDDAIYSNIEQLWDLKGDLQMLSLTREARSLASTHDATSKTTWNVGGRIGDPAYDEFLCPSDISAGLRETLKAVEEPLAKLFGVSAKNTGLGRDAKLGRKHPLNTLFAQLATSYRVAPPVVYLSEVPSIRIFTGTPATVVLHNNIANINDEPICRFVAAYCLQLIRFGLGPATVMSADDFYWALSCVIKTSIPDHCPVNLDEQKLAAKSAQMAEALSTKVRKHIQPFAFDCADALDSKNIHDHILEVGYRAGFMGAGSLTGAIKALALTGCKEPSSDLVHLPGATTLMPFLFSRDHLELRTRLGI